MNRNFRTPSIGKTAKREFAYVPVRKVDPNKAGHPYDTIRVGSRFANRILTIEVFPAISVWPLGRRVDIPCDAEGLFLFFYPKPSWSDASVAEWGKALHFGILDDVDNRIGKAWGAVLMVCENNGLEPLPNA